MSSDLYLVIGIILAGLAIPAMISAFSDGRPPRSGAILVLIGGTLIVVALMQRPGGYAIADIPQAFMRVLGDIRN